MSSVDASLYDSTVLNTSASGAKGLYSRNASVPMLATLDTACELGSLVENQTQLDATSSLSRENSKQFYKFTLEGDNLKLSLPLGSEAASVRPRVQLLNSSGKVIADSSSFASDELQSAYKEITSKSGLDTKAGDYYVKVSYDVTSMKSTKLSYTLSLYSGTKFTDSYKTVAKPQTSDKQNLLTDKTMTFSTIDALSYSVDTAHVANEDASTAINIGWLYENKSALSVTSQMTDVCSTQYYTFTLQKGENLKFAFSNHTDTQDIRIQILDSSGTQVIADSHGTDKQKAAYKALNSEDGLAADTGQYLVKMTYADEGTHKQQIYDFKLYAGDSYNSYYLTQAGTETRSVAFYSGHLTTNYTVESALATYLTGVSQGEETSIMDAISKIV
ncbi:MAG: hypothetical protein PHW63_03750 [Alphaproteobacteria bacterium]|nr:hypothetical protein [Alphaproteobacteria bacterium]